MVISVRSRPRFATIATAVVVLTSPAMSAQTPTSHLSADAPAIPALLATPAFARLVVGTKVIVATADGRTHRGVFRISETGLVADGRHPEEPVPLDQILKVRRVTHRLRYGTLLGLAAGVAIGALVPAPAGCDPQRGPSGAFMALYGAIGAGAGMALGGALTAVSRDLDVIYDARRPTRSVTVAPILTPARKGVAFSMTWR